MKLLLSLITLLLAVSLSHAAEPVTSAAAPAFTGKNTQGADVSLADYAGKIVVLEWTNPDCPFVKKHYSGGNMQGLQSNYTAKGIIWLTICSSAAGKQGHYSAEAWTTKIQEQGIASTAVILDADGTIGHTYGAKNTPFMVVIGTDGNIAYQGAIDDKASTESSDIPLSVNYVSTALNEILDGKPVTTPTAKPYGCGVKYAE